SAHSGLTSTRDAQPLARRDPGRNLHLIRLGLCHLASSAAHIANVTRALTRAAAMLAGGSTTHRNRPDRASHRLFKGNHDVPHNVLPSLGSQISGFKPAANAGPPTARGTEDLLEEIAESRPAK